MVYTQDVSQEVVVRISVYIVKAVLQRSQPSVIYI